MNQEDRESLLHGAWIHADEEGNEDEVVFHTAEYSFPPRRMPRTTITIEKNGVARIGSSGPADRNVQSPVSWEIDNDCLSISGATRFSGQFQIFSLDKGTLVLKRII